VKGEQSHKSVDWPTKGVLEFQNVSVRYQPQLPKVLNDLNLKIESGLKVGILGRTGAGKSTFMASIYKSFEDYEGNILIDGKEISGCDLKNLRKSITIIPQDPHLFEDTLRKNLDPLDEKEDYEIIHVLQNLGIWQKFIIGVAEGEKTGLNYKIENDSKNLSQGEKQLLCMGRAMLHKNKLILLDEATANIDVITEAKIQRTITENFGDSTVLMIAHRLNTIMFCDKILVLENGKKLEYDDLNTLKKNPQSVFRKMLDVNEDIKEYIK